MEEVESIHIHTNIPYTYVHLKIIFVFALVSNSKNWKMENEKGTQTQMQTFFQKAYVNANIDNPDNGPRMNRERE